jgi:hypothetical protein
MIMVIASRDSGASISTNNKLAYSTGAVKDMGLDYHSSPIQKPQAGLTEQHGVSTHPTIF